MKPFGCASFPHMRPYSKHKLHYHSTQCINLGLSPIHKGYKCLTSEGKIIISKDVTFDETSIPYATQFSTQTTLPNLRTLDSSLLTQTFTSPCNTPPTPPSHLDATTPAQALAPNIISHGPNPSTSSSIEQASSFQSYALPLPEPVTHSPTPPPTKTHPMITRSQTGSLKPKLFLTHIKPSSVKLALNVSHWEDTMKS